MLNLSPDLFDIDSKVDEPFVDDENEGVSIQKQ